MPARCCHMGPTGAQENAKRLAPLVDRVLKGAKPATIPVEQANVYEFVANLRTALALGVKLPGSIMPQATRRSNDYEAQRRFGAFCRPGS